MRQPIPASVKTAQAKLGAAAAGQLIEDTLAACAVAARDQVRAPCDRCRGGDIGGGDQGAWRDAA